MLGSENDLAPFFRRFWKLFATLINRIAFIHSPDECTLELTDFTTWTDPFGLVCCSSDVTEDSPGLWSTTSLQMLFSIKSSTFELDAFAV